MMPVFCAVMTAFFANAYQSKGPVDLLLIILLILFLVRSSWERKHPRVTVYPIESGNLPEAFDGLKIVYLADLHDASFGENNKILSDMVLEEKPDMILFGGDMTRVLKKRPERDEREYFIQAEQLLTAFSGIPMYWGHGNHELRLMRDDRYADIRKQYLDLLKDHCVTLLSNETVTVNKDGEEIYISSVDMEPDAYRKGRKRPLPAGFLKDRLGIPGSGFHIVLSHTPLYMEELTQWGADLVLSGHFHGGTIRLPLLGGVMTPQFQFFSKYCRGRIDTDRGAAVVSGGLGTHSVNIRFMNRPDIVKIILVRKKHES